MSRIILTIALAMSAWLAPVPSEAQTYPWCAQYSRGGGAAQNCGFATRAQCQATVSGIGGFCERNPAYQRSSEGRGRRGTMREY